MSAASVNPRGTARLGARPHSPLLPGSVEQQQPRRSSPRVTPPRLPEPQVMVPLVLHVEVLSGSSSAQTRGSLRPAGGGGPNGRREHLLSDRRAPPL